MKKVVTLFAAVVMIASFSNTVLAQSSTTATASATIVTPIAIAKNTDMNFGNVAVTSTGGTVVLTPAGVTTPTGGVTLPVTAPGDISAATFTVTGVTGYAYCITLPTSCTLSLAGSPLILMTVSDFISIPDATGTAPGAGIIGDTGEVSVGATLHVDALQTAGVYTSATPFTVTVNYN